MPDTATSFALVLIVGLAVWQDLVEHEIPNVLTFGALVAGLMTQSIHGGFTGLLYALAGAGVGLACLMPMYLGRGMGAGDVKLMIAVGAFLGPGNAFLAAVLALVTGAVLAIALVLWRLVELRPLLEASPRAEASTAWRAVATISAVRKERFPYAVAIAVGTTATLWFRGSLTSPLAALGIG